MTSVAAKTCLCLGKDARGWYERQSENRRLELQLIALTLVLVGCVTGLLLGYESLDERISSYYGYKVTGCHHIEISRVLEEADSEIAYECEGGDIVTESTDHHFRGIVTFRKIDKEAGDADRAFDHD